MFFVIITVVVPYATYDYGRNSGFARGRASADVRACVGDAQTERDNVIKLLQSVAVGYNGYIAYDEYKRVYWLMQAYVCNSDVACITNVMEGMRDNE